MFAIPLHPRIMQFGEIPQGILHIPFSTIYMPAAYSNLYASALLLDRKHLPRSNIFANMFRRNLKPLIVGAVVFIAGLVSFFFIWAEADAIRPPPWARAIWPLVSFPVFSVTPRLFATMYFWELAFLNNLV